MIMPECDYAVYLVELPYKVHGMIVCDEDGFASIYLNARDSYSMQRRALRHELLHLLRNDAYSNRSIRQVEAM